MESIIERLKDAARRSWPGSTGDRRAEDLEKLLRARLPEYEQALGLPQKVILEALESKRDCGPLNFYQESELPPLAEVRVFEDVADFMQHHPSKKYCCPACEGISTNPYECNSGNKLSHGKTCDWKAYGLLRTMGKGMRFAFRGEHFLQHPRFDEIFMPLEVAQSKGGSVSEADPR